MRFTRATLCAAGALGALALACTDHVATGPATDAGAAAIATARRRSAPLAQPSPTNAIFGDGFESGTLTAWQDGVNPRIHRIITDSTLAHSGTRVLEMIYPVGQGGGWLTHFFMPGVDSVYVSYWVRLQSAWSGSTALLSLRGSRTDSQWSAFGKSGVCPTGSDFFLTGVVAGAASNPLDLAFSTYYAGMSPSASGGCTGQSQGMGATTYAATRRLTAGVWHQVALWVKLNTVGQSDGVQRMWLDGQLAGEWTGLTFRTSSVLMLNSLMLDGAAIATKTEHLYIDDVQVLPWMPGTVTPPPPAPVATVSVALNAPSLTIGESTQAVAVTRDSVGNVLTGRSVTWSSSNPSVATVSTNGLVSAVGAGSTSIIATSEGKSGQSTLTVVAPVASVSVTLAASSLTVGQTTQANAVTKDASGNVLNGRTLTWSSSNVGVATVTPAGVVTAIGSGSTTIIATSESKTGSATVTVSAPSRTVDTLFTDSFESGGLGDANRWQDIVGTFASIANASAEGIAAPTGSNVLKLSGSGGAISHFVSTGPTSPYEHLYLSYKMLRTSAYQAANPGLRAGGIRGSVTQWGSFGVGYGTPGSCPDDPSNVHQQQFMFAYVFEDPTTWALRTYTEWLGEQKLTQNRPTCGGNYAISAGSNPPATYDDPSFVPSVNTWHQYEIEVQLNDVGQANGWQRMWVDGVLKIEHLNVTYRTTSGLKLWAVTFDTGTLQGGALYVDAVVVSTGRGR